MKLKLRYDEVRRATEIRVVRIQRQEENIIINFCVPSLTLSGEGEALLGNICGKLITCALIIVPRLASRVLEREPK